MSERSPDDAVELDWRTPWPGLAAWTRNDAGQFSGREPDLNELHRRVKRAVGTVLYGQSGLGKTSLLQAGLVPRLEADHYLPVFIHLIHQPGASHPCEQVRVEIEKALKAAEFFEPVFPAADENCWRYLHRRDVPFLTKDGYESQLVLIFDQFEEIFTSGQKTEAQARQSREFFELLADLVQNRTPAAVNAELEANPGAREQLKLREHDYHVLMALREDYLPHLNTASGRFVAPDLVSNLQRLLPFDGCSALAAVEGPGAGLFPDNDCVAEQIVRQVAAVKKEEGNLSVAFFGERDGAPQELEHLSVDPAILSLVCERLNATRLDRQKQTGQPQLIAAALLKDLGVKHILERFYKESLEALPVSHREPVAEFIEEKLLSESGRYRQPVVFDSAEKMLVRKGIAPAEAKQILEDLITKKRLLRREDRGWIELTHDVLCDTIRASRDLRRARQHRLQWWKNISTAAAAILFVAALGATIFAWKQSDKLVDADKLAMAKFKKERDDAFWEDIYAPKITDAGDRRHFVEAALLRGSALDREKGGLDSLPKLEIKATVGEVREEEHEEAEHEASKPLKTALTAGLTDPFPDRGKYTWVAPAGTIKVSESGISNVIPWPPGPGLFVLTKGDSSWNRTEDVHYIDLSKPRPPLALSSTLRRSMVVDIDQIDIPDETLQEPDFQLVPALDVNHEGSRALLVDFNGQLRVWNIATGDPVPVAATTERLTAAVFLRQSDAIAVARNDGFVAVLPSDGKVERPLNKAPQAVRVLACSPDGSRLLGGGQVQQITPTGEQQSGGGVHNVRAAVQQQQRQADQTNVWEWDLHTGKLDPKRQWKLPDRVMSLAFAADGKRFLTASMDGTIEIRDAATGELVGKRKVPGGVESCAWSPDGQSLLVGGRDGKARLWKVDQPTDLILTVAIGLDDELKAMANRHPEKARDFARIEVAFGPKAKTILAGNHWDRLGQWDAETGKAVVKPAELENQIFTRFAVTPNGDVLRAGLSSTRIGMKDRFGVFGFRRENDQFVRITPLSPLGSPQWKDISAFTVSPANNRVIVAEEGNRISLFDFADPNEEPKRVVGFGNQSLVPEKASIEASETASQEEVSIAQGQFGSENSPEDTESAEITQLAISHSGKYLAVGFDNGYVAFVDIERPEKARCLWRAKLDNDSIRLLVFLHWDQLLLAGASKFKLYSAVTHQRVDLTSSTQRKMFLPSKDLNARPYDADLITFFAHLGEKSDISTAAIAPDNHLHIQATNDGRVVIAKDGEPSEAIPANMGMPVRAVSFTPDGKYFVSGDPQGNLRFWQILPHPELLSDDRSAIEKKWMLGVRKLVDIHSDVHTEDTWRSVTSNPQVSRAWASLRATEQQLSGGYYLPVAAPSPDAMSDIVRTLTNALHDLSAAKAIDSSFGEQFEWTKITTSEAVPSLADLEKLEKQQPEVEWVLLSARLPEWERKLDKKSDAARLHLKLASLQYIRMEQQLGRPTESGSEVAESRASNLPPNWQPEWAKVEEHLRRTLELGGLDRDEFNMTAGSLLKLGEFKRIKETVDRLPSIEDLEKESRNAEKDDDRRKLCKSYEYLLRQDITPSAMLAVNMGIRYRQLKRYREAMDCHKLALRLGQRDKKVDVQARAYVSMANTANAEEKKEEARKFAVSATEVAPESDYAWKARIQFEITTTPSGSNDKPELQRLVQVYAAAAAKAEKDKNFDAAGAICMGVGRWCCALGDEAQAEKAFDKALKADDTLSAYKEFWDAWSSDTEDGEKWALGKLNAGIQKARTQGDETTRQWLLSRKAKRLREKSHSLREAVTLFQEARKIDSRDERGWATTELAETFRVLGDFPQALEYFKEGEELGDNSSWVHVQKALAFRAQGEIDAALKEHEKALPGALTSNMTNWPSDADPGAYAETLMMAGNIEAALHLANAAVEHTTQGQDDNRSSYILARIKLLFRLLHDRPTDPKSPEWRAALQADVAAVEKIYTAEGDYVPLIRLAILSRNPDKATDMLSKYRQKWPTPSVRTLLAEATIAAMSPKQTDLWLPVRRLAEAISHEFYRWDLLETDPSYISLVSLPDAQKALQLMRLKNNNATGYSDREKDLADWAEALPSPAGEEHDRLAQAVKRLRERPPFNPGATDVPQVPHVGGTTQQ